MRFARKLAYALWLGICVIYGVNGLERFHREAELFENDIRRDHEVMGRGIVAAVAELWADEGEERAVAIVGRANAREDSVTIRWVDPAEPPGGAHTPAAPVDTLAPAGRGEVVHWTDSRGDGTLYTYTPVRVGRDYHGAIEISETLKPEREYLRSSLVRMCLTFGSLATMSGLVAMLLGVLFVGRPIRRLVEKARRVGAGEFDGALDLGQADELGELAAEMNTMSKRLADSRERLLSETRARTTALEQLRHAERLTTVGKLASGVAHELGTPLNVINVRAGMIADGEVEGDEARVGARIIREQSERITRIVRQLLDFARRGAPDRAVHDVAAVMDRTVALLGPLAKQARVDLAVSAAERPLHADVDPVQLQQVLTNLVMNAIQAMPEGGRLRLRGERAAAQAPQDLGGLVTPCVAVHVEDEGVGMEPDTLARVFDPFFTTKPVGEGTGLGLSVAYGIVREHGGWIGVESVPGRGSCFTVYLPGSAA